VCKKQHGRSVRIKQVNTINIGASAVQFAHALLSSGQGGIIVGLLLWGCRVPF
jgi:hypothetical protein